METETSKRKVSISRKTLYGITILVIVIFAGVMIYLFAFSSTKSIRIVRFWQVTEDTYMMEGQLTLPFYVKVENTGSNNVSDLVLVVSVLGGNRELGSDTAHLKTLQAGHRMTMSMVVRVNMSELLGKVVNYVATLYLDSIVVDENTTPSRYSETPTAPSR